MPSELFTRTDDFMINAIVAFINQLIKLVAPERIPDLNVDFLRQAHYLIVHQRDDDDTDDVQPTVRIQDAGVVFDIVDLLERQSWQSTFGTRRGDTRIMFMKGDDVLAVLFVSEQALLRRTGDDGKIQRYQTTLNKNDLARIQRHVKSATIKTTS